MNEKKYGERIGFFANICYGSKKEFANAMNMGPQHLNSYINEKRSPSFDILKKFCDAGLNLEWLMLGVGNFFSNSAKGKKLRIDKRVEALFQITYYYLNKEQVTIEEFNEKANSFACLLGNDDESFNKLKETIENSQPEDFEYPAITDLTLGYSINEEVISVIFDEEFISKNKDFIKKIYTPWPLKSDLLPFYMTLNMWRGLNYGSILPWSMFGKNNEIYRNSLISSLDFVDEDYFKPKSGYISDWQKALDELDKIEDLKNQKDKAIISDKDNN
ncbi:MAG: hypothetical protein A2475_01150 [Ignavibacteria bacterium RIFOXYC2_FULL_35_21]|nr:MAG: hypothetical protein A2220_01895 [Ignavibacteria bacterium RIFOXYA2_FULL_35_10]OGV21252.1 MAG: hypothetical protein A2475_01150 [Ignavibacteria bacterium RIFOXYC2_FULL_35_21]